MMFRIAALWLVLLLGVLPASGWAAPVPICLDITNGNEAPAGAVAKLIASEVARHKSHIVVKADCDTTLFVEFFSVGGTHYITLRMAGEVPLRYSYSGARQLEERIDEGLRLCLGNDPVFLRRNITQFTAMERASYNISVQGENRFALELFEDLVRTGQGVGTMPGLAFTFSRGSRGVAMLGRFHAATNPMLKAPSRLRIVLSTGLEVAGMMETHAKRFASPYLAAGAGIRFVRFSGPVNRGHEEDNDLLFDLLVRGGIRMFRFFDFEMDLFAQFNLPVIPVRNVDTDLYGGNKMAWTPSIQLGVGVVF